MKFWTTLLHEKEIHKIYDMGLSISEGLSQLNSTYQQIEAKQGEKKEIKLYINMSAFYKFVIFKNDEFIAEINKSR